MEDVNYKELYDKLRQDAQLEVNYLRLTVTEKLSVLLAMVAIVAGIVIFAACLLFILVWAALTHLQAVTGSTWAAAGIVAGILALVAFIVYLSRKQLIINPVTRFISKLMIDKPQQ